MNSVLRLALHCVFPVALFLAALPADAHPSPSSMGGDHRHHLAQPSPQALSPAHRYFTDVILVNQDGEPMRLYSDLLQGKVVVVNAFFTRCEASCPAIIGTLTLIQQWLGDRLGREVYLISVSVDPETDTPERLKTYAQELKADPGWYFLTGTKQNVHWALSKLGHDVEDPENHRNVLIIGNEPTGLWKKALGVASPQALIQIIESVLNDRG